MKTVLILLLLSFTQLSAKVLISPVEAMKEQYGEDTVISKKNVLLSNKRFKNIQRAAKTKLTTKIYRIFTAKQEGEVLGYGVLINRKVRSKNGVVLYFIKKSTLQGIEVIAFNEPSEYIPTKKWSAQFKNVNTHTMLRLNRDIPSISGATLSARSVTDGSRIAFGIYNELLEGR